MRSVFFVLLGRLDNYHHAYELQAFNIVRQHSNALLHLLALMATSGIPGVNADAISYVQKALLPEKSKAEASAIFTRMIEDSLRSWFTQFNFFLHNLAQLRFHGDHNDVVVHACFHVLLDSDDGFLFARVPRIVQQ